MLMYTRICMVDVIVSRDLSIVKNFDNHQETISLKIYNWDTFVEACYDIFFKNNIVQYHG